MISFTPSILFIITSSPISKESSLFSGIAFQTSPFILTFPAPSIGSRISIIFAFLPINASTFDSTFGLLLINLAVNFFVESNNIIETAKNTPAWIMILSVISDRNKATNEAT